MLSRLKSARSRAFIIAGLFIIILGVITTIQAATFGKNKVQYTYFKWKYLSTEHYNIYYNQGGREVADFTAEVAEEYYTELAGAFGMLGVSNDPIEVITYQSHNDFEQTNVSSDQPGEGTGGFTEFLKSRIAIPFEGNHAKFRHVIRHELTHAIMLDLLYGRGFSSIMAGISQSRVPLWFIEGLAEYKSHGGLDQDTEMYLRDAVVNDHLPELQYLDQMGYLGVYKCGQSVLYWIAWRYGDEKVSEILHQMKGFADFDRALKASLGINQDELSKRWRRFIRERYWPQVAEMDPPDHNAQALTDHIEEYCYINNSPALSPNGEWLTFLSDRSGYFDVYLMSTIDKRDVRRLVRGQRSIEFEELHWLRPGMSWSPDGERIAFCAKSGEFDALHIIDAKDGDIVKSYKFKSDGLFSPSWSPAGDKIALIRILNGQSDLGIVNLESGKLHMITDDFFDDADPSWSPDSKSLLFTSNRGEHSIGEDILSIDERFRYRYELFDVYKFDIANEELQRLTRSESEERSPLWTPLENTILYASNRSGIYNLYLHNLETDQVSALHNLVTGGFQPTISSNGRSLAFTSYYNNGYDIFSISDPFSGEHEVVVNEVPSPDILPGCRKDRQPKYGISDYSQYVFDRNESEESRRTVVKDDSIKLAERTKNHDGRYLSHDYQVHLSPDLVFVSASYDPYYRMQGSGIVLFTDVLGNHQTFLALDLNQSTDNSNFYINYQYLARRLDLSGGGYHYAYPYYDSYGNVWRDRNWGVFLSTAYPISRYNRIDLGLDYSFIERAVLDRPAGEWRQDYMEGRVGLLMPHVGYIHDTSLWRSRVEPANGGRWRIDALWSPDIFGSDDNGMEFLTLSFDWRRYFAFRKDYSFGFRTSGGVSEGKNPQRFFVGGLMNWFNPRYDNREKSVLIDNVEDMYFSSFITPLRGVGYYNQVGTRYLLGNAEFRFPFIRHLVFGWPLPAYLRDLRGSLFIDYGTAWEETDLGSKLLPDKWVMGFGFGLRLDLGIFPLQWDIAWSPDPSSDMVPVHYLTLNVAF